MYKLCPNVTYIWVYVNHQVYHVTS